MCIDVQSCDFMQEKQLEIQGFSVKQNMDYKKVSIQIQAPQPKLWLFLVPKAIR